MQNLLITSFPCLFLYNNAKITIFEILVSIQKLKPCLR